MKRMLDLATGAAANAWAGANAPANRNADTIQWEIRSIIDQGEKGGKRPQRHGILAEMIRFRLRGVDRRYAGGADSPVRSQAKTRAEPRRRGARPKVGREIPIAPSHLAEKFGAERCRRFAPAGFFCPISFCHLDWRSCHAGLQHAFRHPASPRLRASQDSNRHQFQVRAALSNGITSAPHQRRVLILLRVVFSCGDFVVAGVAAPGESRTKFQCGFPCFS
jgi:hypothetical protein